MFRDFSSFSLSFFFFFIFSILSFLFSGFEISFVIREIPCKLLPGTLQDPETRKKKQIAAHIEIY